MATLTWTQNPTHGPTGSKVVSGVLTVNQDAHMEHYLPPGPARRIVSTWDDDDNQIDRELSDEEYAASVIAHDKAQAEWNRTCGTFMVYGRRWWECKVVCADGCQADGISDDGVEWHWRSWNEKIPPKPNGSDG